MPNDLKRTLQAQCEKYAEEIKRYAEEIRRLEEEKAKYSEKSTVATLLMTLIFGLHRITNGKVLSGILFAVTCGGFIIWWIFDMIKIVTGKFTDQNDKPINSAKVLSLTLKINDYKRTLAELQKKLEEVNAMDVY